MSIDVLKEIHQGQRDWAFNLGVLSYVWGFPLVACWKDRLKKLFNDESGVAVSADRRADMLTARLNRFRHVRHLSTRASSEFVNAATDFLYSTAVLDLTEGPLVLETPDFDRRWYGVQVLDAYMETLANVGTRVHGQRGQRVVIALRGSDIPLADEAEIIWSENRHLYLVTRIELDPSEDIALVHALQDGLVLTPLSTAQNSPAVLDGGAAVLDSARRLWDECGEWEADLAFFYELAEVLKYVPPRPDEGMFAALLNELGIRVGDSFQADTLTPAVRQALTEAIPHAQAILERKIYEVGTNINGWAIVKNIGRYHHQYIIRALVAKHGIWANIPEESLYFMAWTDCEGAVLHGSQQYEIHFAKEALPPVEAFWSISYYDEQGRIIDNCLNKNAIHSRYSNVQQDSSGAVRIVIAPELPPGVPETNWLPSHRGVFNLNLRCYQPAVDLLDLRYSLPPIVKCAACSETDSE